MGGSGSGLPALVARRLATTWLSAWLWAALIVTLAGCAGLPERDPEPRAASRGEMRERVTVRGEQGKVEPRSVRRVLAELGAEGQAELVAHHLRVMAGSGDVDLYRGNAVRLLVDGPVAFDAMKRAISAARDRIFLESYIVEDQGVAAEIGALLERKASEGVSVALIYDSVGSMRTPPEYFASLEKAGVITCAFNPVNPLRRPGYWGINHRDHRKLLVVDNEVAFTGGINISQVYSSGSFRPRPPTGSEDAALDGWRDTQIELRGPVVGAFAVSFGEMWGRQGCRGELGGAYPASVAQPGERVVKVLTSDPGDPENRIYRVLLSAIDAARVSVHVTMAYFVPGADMIQALCDAAGRGVHVSLLLPGRSDFALVLHGGRSYYSQLLACGVEIHEMAHALLHAKTAVIDGVLSTVGSSNMDWRSFVMNSEINVIVLGAELGAEMEALFEKDLAAARRIDPEEWERRGAWQRLMEAVGRMAERLL